MFDTSLKVSQDGNIKAEYCITAAVSLRLRRTATETQKHMHEHIQLCRKFNCNQKQKLVEL